MDESFIPHPCFMTSTRLVDFLKDRTLAIFFGDTITSSLYSYLSYYKHVRDSRNAEPKDEAIKSSQPVKSFFMKLVNGCIFGLPEKYSFYSWEGMKDTTKTLDLDDASLFAFHFGRYLSHEQTIAYVMSRRMGFERMLGVGDGPVEGMSRFQSRSLGGKSVSFYFFCNALYTHWGLPSYVAHLASIFVRIDKGGEDSSQALWDYNDALDDIERITGKSEKHVALVHALAYFMACPHNRKNPPAIEINVPEKKWIGLLMYRYFKACKDDGLGESDKRFESYCLDTVNVLSDYFHDRKLLEDEYSRVSEDATDWWEMIKQKINP